MDLRHAVSAARCNVRRVRVPGVVGGVRRVGVGVSVSVAVSVSVVGVRIGIARIYGWGQRNFSEFGKLLLLLLADVRQWTGGSEEDFRLGNVKLLQGSVM